VIIELLDQVLMSFFSPEAFIVSTLASRLG
jgi:hypothetical protein